MTTNAQLIALCQRIAGVAEVADRFRAYGRMAIEHYARDEMLRTASSLDDDLCQLCTELRLACRPRDVEPISQDARTRNQVAAVLLIREAGGVLDEFT